MKDKTDSGYIYCCITVAGQLGARCVKPRRTTSCSSTTSSAPSTDGSTPPPSPGNHGHVMVKVAKDGCKLM